MSYEGYEQCLCATGHLFEFDCYQAPDLNKFRCNHCGQAIVWANNVDETNGSYDKHGNRIDGRVFLDKVEDGDITGVPTYHMPRPEMGGRYLGVKKIPKEHVKGISKPSVSAATPMQQEFLQELLKVCRKYHININSSEMDMYYGSDVEKPITLEVVVNGAWDIREEDDAAVAYEIVQKIHQSWRVKGTSTRKH